jgi:hypothetical protein
MIFQTMGHAIQIWFTSETLEGSLRKLLSPSFSPNRYVTNLYAKAPVKMFSKLRGLERVRHLPTH